MSPAAQSARYRALGATLRRARELVQPRLTQARLAQALGWDQSKVSLIESGRQVPSPDDITMWAHTVGADAAVLLEVRHRAIGRDLDLQNAARRPGGAEALQGDLAALEAGSSVIAEYQPTVIPGLAQTADYTRAWITQPGRPDVDDGVDVDQLLERRAERQAAARERGTRIVVAVEPWALTAVYGSARVQRKQLKHLADLAEEGAVELLVTTHPIAILGGFELLDDAVVIESVWGARILAEPGAVVRFAEVLNGLRTAGKAGPAALAVIEAARGAVR